MLDYIVLAVWGFAGAVTLVDSRPITRVDYACCWIVLLSALILRAIK